MENPFMIEAIKEACKALEIGEVPVGAIIVRDNKIISGHIISGRQKTRLPIMPRYYALKRHADCSAHGGLMTATFMSLLNHAPCVPEPSLTHG